MLVKIMGGNKMTLIEKWTEQRLWKMIERFDGQKIEKILRIAMRRYEMLNPETEMLYATLPKYNRQERKVILDSMCTFLMNQKTDSLE